MATKFGFEVRKDTANLAEDIDGPYEEVEVWSVLLPHQCEAWGIAGDAVDGIRHEQAVSELEAFIAQAQDALAALRDKREVAEEG